MKKMLMTALLASTLLSAPALANNSNNTASKIKALEAKLAKFEKIIDNMDSHIEKEVDARLQQKLELSQSEQSKTLDLKVSKAVEQEVAKKAASIPTAAGSTTVDNLEIKLNPTPYLKTADGGTTFALDGRIIVDAGFVDADESSLQSNATDIRYAWLGAKGTIDHDWAYRFLVGLENDSTTVNDMWFAYNGFDNTSLKIGNYKEFQGIEAMSSNLHNTFQERSAATTTFRPLRTIGLSSTFYGENWSLQAGAFGDDPGNTDANDEGHSFTGRFVYAPILDKSQDHLLHLGVSGSYRVPDGSDDSVRFRARGESNVINRRLVDTGVISDVDNFTTLGFETRYTLGNLALMAEYNMVNVERDSGLEDYDFNGGYVSASYFLTGEQRGYKMKSGTYGRVKPLRPFSLHGDGMGAWEVAARYSNLDLNDGSLLGGELDAITLGVNWYPTSNTKFMLNYIMNETDANGTAANDEPNYITLRAQLDF